MAWDFETDPDFQSKLDWVKGFVRSEIEPLDHVLGDPYDKTDARRGRFVRCSRRSATLGCGRAT